MATRVINLSTVPLSEDEVSVLCLGLSFTPVPKADVFELERDMYEFTRRLRLMYHFRNDNTKDESLVRSKSSFCPNRHDNEELEEICSSIEKSSIKICKPRDNIGGLRMALDSLMRKTRNNELVIKPADKGSIIVVMSPQFYWDMCLRHLNNPVFYVEVPGDPCTIIMEKLNSFLEKYKSRLTSKEFQCLSYSDYKLSNFYMLPKLHKSVEVNSVVEAERKEYIHIPGGVTDLDGRPIVSGPSFHTRNLSVMIHCILLPCLDHIKYILRDSFDFQEKLDHQCHPDTLFVTWDIKSLYTSIRHDLFYTAVEFWLDKLGDRIPLLNRFGRNFVMEALKIILELNYFMINGMIFHQLMGTAMGTPAAVVGANLVVAFLEIKMFRLLPQLYPRDFVDFLVRSFFRFLDDLFHEWLPNFDIQPLYELLNSLDPDVKFLLDAIRNASNYLDLTVSRKERRLVFDIYHKPTNSFNYLKYTSCHPLHTKKNIALSLGRRIIKLCSAENHQKNLQELKDHLVKCDHPPSVIDDAFNKLFAAPPPKETEDCIPFVHTYNPGQSPNFNLLNRCLDQIRSPSMKKAFHNKRPLLTTRQPPNLRKLLTKAKFDMTPPPPRPIRQVGLFPCGNCKYCELGYIKPATEIVMRRGTKIYTWKYSRLFTCNSINVLYVLICRCLKYYVGKTGVVKTRISKHASDVRHPENSNCKKCTNHLRECSKLIEPFFQFFPFFYAEEPGLRHFMETRFRLRFRPVLNS